MIEARNVAAVRKRPRSRALLFLLRGVMVTLLIAAFCPTPALRAQEATGQGETEINGIPPAVQIQIYLQAGWNLISFRVQPTDPSNTILYTKVADVLRDIDGLYEAVLSYDQDALSYYCDLPPEFNDLKEMDPYHGYWIKMKEPATLDLWGRTVPANYSLTLHKGWNLISYLPKTRISVAEALGNIEGQYTAVLGWHDGEAVSYYTNLPPAFNDLKCMRPQHGYWINVTQDTTLSYRSMGSCAE